MGRGAALVQSNTVFCGVRLSIVLLYPQNSLVFTGNDNGTGAKGVSELATAMIGAVVAMDILFVLVSWMRVLFGYGEPVRGSSSANNFSPAH